MTPEELREKVARALFEHTGENHLLGALCWEDTGNEERQQWFGRADAALSVVREAMREPSAAMLRAAGNLRGYDPNDFSRIPDVYYMQADYRAMFAASPLAEPGE